MKDEVRLNQCDREILYFLWRWKVATTRALTVGFFADRSPVTAYKRLWKLERGKVIQSIAVDRQARHRVWTLSKLGFEILKQQYFLPELQEEGFRSENITHDLVTMAMHLGEYHLGCPSEVGLFTEQELRRLYPEMYPDWVPRSQRHRADGYWRVPIGNKTKIITSWFQLAPMVAERRILARCRG